MIRRVSCFLVTTRFSEMIVVEILCPFLKGIWVFSLLVGGCEDNGEAWRGWRE